MSVTDIGQTSNYPTHLIETLAQRAAGSVAERLDDTSSRRSLTVDQATEYFGRYTRSNPRVKRGERTGYRSDPEPKRGPATRVESAADLHRWKWRRPTR